MKILTLNWGSGPYSISKIIQDIESVLSEDGVEFLHIQESGKELKENYKSLSGWLEYRICYIWAHITGRQYGTGFIPYLKFCHILRTYRPDIVHIHCPNAFSVNLFKVLGYLKKHKMPTVITNHAEFFYTGNCAYAENCTKFLNGCGRCPEYKTKTHSWFFDRTAWSWKKMREAFEGFEKLAMVAVSPWVCERMKLSPISRELPLYVIGNGIDTNIFKYEMNSSKSQDSSETLGDGNILGGKNVDLKDDKMKKVLYVTAQFSDKPENLKGGYYMIELARQCQDIPVRFIVVGGGSVTSILPSNIEVIGEVADQRELAEYYRNADITLLTSKRETFGMTCAESLSCGTPVVGFKNGGTESIAIPEYSGFVEYGDVEGLKDMLIKMLSVSYDSQQLSQKAMALYAKETMSGQYYKIYKNLL